MTFKSHINKNWQIKYKIDKLHIKTNKCDIKIDKLDIKTIKLPLKTNKLNNMSLNKLIQIKHSILILFLSV